MLICCILQAIKKREQPEEHKTDDEEAVDDVPDGKSFLLPILYDSVIVCNRPWHIIHETHAISTYGLAIYN